MPPPRHWPRLLLQAGKDAIADEVPMLASAIAFNAFLAIPATLLLVVGFFSLVADPGVINDLMEKVGSVVPAEAVTLVEDSLLQLEQNPSSGILMTVVGFVLALWTATGAVNTLMTAVNRAHELDDERGFLRKRAIAALLVVALGVAVLSVTAFLVLGPHIQRWIGAAFDAERTVSWIWWTAQWPILLIVLFASFAVVFGLAMDHPNRRWRFISPGAAVAVVLWLAVSAGFAFYASRFGSYNKTWGSLSAAIVTLVWLYLSAIALLFGAEVNAEAERATENDELDVSDTVARTAASPLRPAK
ncbi:YihY/virulence factor BrkB family protein [soil metagenome]